MIRINVNAVYTKDWTVEERKNLLLETLALHYIQPERIGLYTLYETDFFTAPASTKYHAAYEGGLFDHSMNVLMVLLYFRKIGLVAFQRPESPFIVALFHDTTKLSLYKKDYTGKYIHNEQYLSFGVHGYDSAHKTERYTMLSDEEWCCIRYHMGAYETDCWDDYDRAIKEFPSVLWTHTADMVASKLLERDEPNEISDNASQTSNQ